MSLKVLKTKTSRLVCNVIGWSLMTVCYPCCVHPLLNTRIWPCLFLYPRNFTIFNAQEDTRFTIERDSKNIARYVIFVTARRSTLVGEFHGAERNASPHGHAKTDGEAVLLDQARGLQDI